MLPDCVVDRLAGEFGSACLRLRRGEIDHLRRHTDRERALVLSS
jgi:hypothetical protein